MMYGPINIRFTGLCLYICIDCAKNTVKFLHHSEEICLSVSLKNVCQFGVDKFFEIREGFGPHELISYFSCKKHRAVDTKICLY